MTPFPLKFRVWSKATKKWLHSITLTDTGVPLLFYVEKEKAIGLDGEEETGVVINRVYQIDEYEPVIQWWTGLKDNNGQDIYEGDILSVQDAIGKPYLIKAEWTDRGGFEANFPGFDGKTLNYHIGSIRPPLSQVIGNILENPDLIKLPEQPTYNDSV